MRCCVGLLLTLLLLQIDDDSDVEPSVPGLKRKRTHEEEDKGYFSFDDSDSESEIDAPRPMKRLKAATPPRMASNSAATMPTSQRSRSATYVQASPGTSGGRTSTFEKSV